MEMMDEPKPDDLCECGHAYSEHHTGIDEGCYRVVGPRTRWSSGFCECEAFMRPVSFGTLV